MFDTSTDAGCLAAVTRHPELRALARLGHPEAFEIVFHARLAVASATPLPRAPKPGHEHSPPGRSRWAR